MRGLLRAVLAVAMVVAAAMMSPAAWPQTRTLHLISYQEDLR
ncbi:MAG TPA: hypothetical protein VEI03_19535 [Stellaceae bacterium]|nr:hypothetical protein [Stellaceae bacterium]